MKKAIALALSVIICATALLTGTIAFFTDEETKENVFGVGYVDIIQHEQERDENTDTGLDDFTQDQKLYPLVDKNNGESETVAREFDGTEVKLVNPERLGGYIDKIVTVENNGKNAAYLRNIVAVPTGGTDQPWLHVHFGDAADPAKAVRTIDWAKANGTNAPEVEDVEIDGELYDLYVFEYIGVDPENADPAIPAGHFQPGDSTVPTLLGFWMDGKVNFEEKLTETSGKYYDENGKEVKYPVTQEINGVDTVVGAYYYPLENGERVYISLNAEDNHIYVVSQAVQVDGFSDFDQAFQQAFKGDITKDNHPWYKGDSGSQQPGEGGQNPGEDAEGSSDSNPPTVSYVGKTTDGHEYSWDDLLTKGLVELSSSDTNAITTIDKSIAELYIPEGITSIIAPAANGNTNLKKVEFPSTLKFIQGWSFYNTGLESVTIPASVSFSNVANSMYSNIFEGCTSLTSVIVENGVNLIPNSCFKNCTALSSVSIPESITELCTSAFRGCSSLTSIRLPEELNTAEFKATTAFRDTPIATDPNNKIIWY